MEMLHEILRARSEEVEIGSSGASMHLSLIVSDL